MAKFLLSDQVWERLIPLLPLPKPRRARFPGRKPIDDRRALTGILFVLKSGIPWEYLPQEMGCGSGMTCWRRLRDWQQSGVWNHLRAALENELADSALIDWARADADPRQPRGSASGGKAGFSEGNGPGSTGSHQPPPLVSG